MQPIDAITKFYKAIGLKPKLVGAVLMTVGVTAAIVHVPWLLTSKRNVEDLARQVNHQVMAEIALEVRDIFNAVTAIQQLIDLNVRNGLVNLQNPQQRADFFLSLLQTHPTFTWVQFGYANGDYLGAQRTFQGDREQIRLHFRQWNAQKQQSIKWLTQYELQDKRLKPIQQKRFQESIPYYSPQRPWYRNALQQRGQQVWTVYVYRTGNVPGVDSSITLEQNGKLTGVIGIGFELNALSRYLKAHHQQLAGRTFILNAKGELIASSDPDETTPTQRAGQDEPQLISLPEVKNPYLQVAAKAIPERQIQLPQLRTLQEFIYQDPGTGKKYFVSLAPLGYADWIGGIVVEESAYMKEINRNNQALFLTLAGFITLLAGAVVWQTEKTIARPLQQLIDAAIQVELGSDHVDLEPTVLRADELGKLARSFQTMIQQVQSRERELEARVQDRTEELMQAQIGMEVSLREKEVLLKEIHHRVKNNLQVITSLLRLQSRHIENEQAIQVFEDSQNRIRAMALIHEKLYQSDDLAQIDFAGYVDHLAKELVQVHALQSHRIQLILEIQNIHLGIDTAVPCGLILSELISNALKHGFPNQTTGAIVVRMVPTQQQTYELIVRDNGVGFPPDINPMELESLGLKLVTSLVRQLRGHLTLATAEATEFKIVFPIPADRST